MKEQHIIVTDYCKLLRHLKWLNVYIAESKLLFPANWDSN